MGFADKLKKFVTGKTDEELEEEKKQKEAEESGEEFEEKGERYAGEVCALCGGTGADKKWAGQYWHKACSRKLRKQGKKMI